MHWLNFAEFRSARLDFYGKNRTGHVTKKSMRTAYFITQPWTANCRKRLCLKSKRDSPDRVIVGKRNFDNVFVP